MRLSIRNLSLAAIALTLAACGTNRYYTLPVGPNQADSTFAPLKYAAEQAGFTAYINPDGVTVDVDPVSTIYFQRTPQEFQMQVSVDDKKVPPSELEAKIRATKMTGDKLWHDAMAARRETGTIIIGN